MRRLIWIIFKILILDLNQIFKVYELNMTYYHDFWWRDKAYYNTNERAFIIWIRICVAWGYCHWQRNYVVLLAVAHPPLCHARHYRRSFMYMYKRYICTQIHMCVVYKVNSPFHPHPLCVSSSLIRSLQAT